MPKYPTERKQAILCKMAPPHNMTVAALAIEEGISDATLYNWRKSAREEDAIFARLKQYRTLACRFDKLRKHYEGVVTMACPLLWLPM